MCSQKKVTQNAPWAPRNALFRLSTSSTSASTTSAPSFSSTFALSDPAFLVRARTRYPPPASFRTARHIPPPCAPVAPTTAMIFLSSTAILLCVRASIFPPVATLTDFHLTLSYSIDPDR